MNISNQNLIIQNNYTIELYSNNKKLPSSNNVFKISNNQPINIKLYNNNSSRCDVHIYTQNDKKLIGIYRINPHNSILISEKKIKKNMSLNLLFKPEAGSCGYGCIQEYDKYCTNTDDKPTIKTGPKGEVNIYSNNQKFCKFGPDYINQFDEWTRQYQQSTGNLKSVINSDGKIVPSLNDIDYSRVSKMSIQIGG